MNRQFQELVAGLEGKAGELLKMERVLAEKVPPNTPVGGVYLFSDGTQNLYVGRTKRKISL